MRAWLRKLLSRPIPAAGTNPRPPAPPQIPPSRTPIAPPDASNAGIDIAVIRENWNAHLRHHPHLSWPQFLDILEQRRRFFAEERRDREARLDALTKRDR